VSEPEKPAPTTPGAGAVDKEELKKAMKAFKKRLKLMKRDDESGIGRGGAMPTKGESSGIVAIVPPDGFKPEVWAALVAAGRLKKTPGRTTYELVKQDED
jgi:hypothetical protein